jgi:hypothetical protein
MRGNCLCKCYMKVNLENMEWGNCLCECYMRKNIESMECRNRTFGAFGQVDGVLHLLNKKAFLWILIVFPI